jgi:hypothetical protein
MVDLSVENIFGVNLELHFIPLRNYKLSSVSAVSLVSIVRGWPLWILLGVKDQPCAMTLALSRGGQDLPSHNKMAPSFELGFVNGLSEYVSLLEV